MKRTPHVARAGLWALGAALLIAGCTRTIYVVQNPDGSLSPLEPVEEPRDEVVVIDDDVLQVEVLPGNEYVLIDGDDDVVYILVDLGADMVETFERAPMNVALVLDRSGSMAGEKLEHAKNAAIALIGDMADGDRVALLSYASEVTLEVPTVQLDSRNRARLRHAVEGLQAAGGTDLAGGLSNAAREALRAYHADDLNRVILVSDGRPTIGDTNPWQIETAAARFYEEGLTVTTMGIGVDYNEDLMTSVAIAGGGNYYYIASHREMAGAFDMELRGLGATVVRDLELHFELPPDVTLREVYGYRHEQRGDDVVIRMSSLAAGQKRRLLMAVDVPERTRDALTVARGRLTYRNEVSGSRRDVKLPDVRVAYTRDRARVARGYKRPVIEKLESVRNARLRNEVMDRLDKGDDAGAKRLVHTRVKRARAVESAVGGAALKGEMKRLYDFADEVESAPARRSPRYQHLKKAEKARAHDAMMR